MGQRDSEAWSHLVITAKRRDLASFYPVWEPTVDSEPAAEAFVARRLLGAGWVAGSRKLSMLDLRVWAALLGQLGAQLPVELPDDPTLANADTRNGPDDGLSARRPRVGG